MQISHIRSIAPSKPRSKKAPAFKRFIRAVSQQLFERRCITIDWEGKRITHWGRNATDIAQWLACYPTSTSARIDRYGIFSRYPVQTVHLKPCGV